MSKYLQINSTQHSPGRFGNQFFRNMVAHILAKNGNIRFKYGDFDKMCNLGIDLYNQGTNVFPSSDTILINNDNFMECILNSETQEIPKNIQFHQDTYAQTRDFAIYLKFYFEKNGIFQQILDKNQFRERYNENNDVYIHIRLGDVPQFNPGFEYYDQCMQETKEWTNAYISSDTIGHPICQALIRKYNMIIVNYGEINTILFASTCSRVILSNGTYSWLIGFLAIFSQVYYPKIIQEWHGDIFVFPEWKEIKVGDINQR